MVVLGFLSDSIQAVDWTIKFIIQLGQVQDQVHDLRRELEHSRGKLKRLEDLLLKSQYNTDGWLESIIALLKEFNEALSDSVNLLKQFYPDVPSNSGFFPGLKQNLKWMVDNRYQGNVKGLRERILKIEGRIDSELIFRIYQLSDNPQPAPPLAQQLATAPPPSGETEDTKPHANHETARESPPPTLSRSQTASTDATICVPYNNTHPAPSIKRASTLQYAPTPFTQEALPIKGVVKVWFRTGIPNRLQPHIIQRVAILRDSAGYFRGIMMTRHDGRTLKEEIPQFWRDVARHPLPVHGQHTRDARDSDGQARNCITFLYDDRGPATPRFYSFTSDEDYRVFQSKIVGKTLLFWAEVNKISSAWSKTTPLSEYQIVQLWQSNGAQSIQFFRNGKHSVYSQHSMSSLRVGKWGPKEFRLDFLGSEGTPPLRAAPTQEQMMKYLSIVFTNPKDPAGFLEKADLRRK